MVIHWIDLFISVLAKNVLTLHSDVESTNSIQHFASVESPKTSEIQMLSSHHISVVMLATKANPPFFSYLFLTLPLFYRHIDPVCSHNTAILSCSCLNYC